MGVAGGAPGRRGARPGDRPLGVEGPFTVDGRRCTVSKSVGPGGAVTPPGLANTYTGGADMPDRTGAASRRKRTLALDVPNRDPRVPWRTLYGDLSMDEGGRVVMGYRAYLFELGLSERAVYIYSRKVWALELHCRQHGQRLAGADLDLVHAWIQGRQGSDRRQARAALGHFWRWVNRPDVADLLGEAAAAVD